MKLLKKIRQYIFSDFSVIVVPNTRKSTKQFRLNAFSTYSIIATLVILTIYVFVGSVINHNDRIALESEIKILNAERSSNLKTTEALRDTNSLKDDEITNLSNFYDEESLYLYDLIDGNITLKIELNNAIATFNTENNSDMSIPVSRSLDRASVQDVTSFRNIDDKLAKMDLEEIKEQDELTQVVYSMKEDLSNLISEVEDELEYLDCLPDLPPIEGRLSSGFGYRSHPITGLRSFHYGIDITSSRGTPVQVAGSGVVVFSGWRGGFGKVIIVSHGYGYETVYAHNNEIYAIVGETVSKGDVISAVGNTGNSTGPHLHFEIRLDGEAIDPTGVLRYDR